MTISSEVRKAGPFDGNDVATTFPFAFKVFTQADLLVVRADPSGDEAVLAMGSDYTVALNPDQNESPGGSVTLNVPLAIGYVLVVTSQVGNLQPVDLTNQGGFYPNVINAALDRATIQIQQLAEEMSRAAKLPITRDEDVDELLNDLVRVADNLDDLNTVAGIAPEIQAVAAIDSDVVVVADHVNEIQAALDELPALSTKVWRLKGAVSQASGSALDIGIDEAANEFLLEFIDVAVPVGGGGAMLLRVGNPSGILSTGYKSIYSASIPPSTFWVVEETTGIAIGSGMPSAGVVNGVIRAVRRPGLSGASFWRFSGTLYGSGDLRLINVVGRSPSISNFDRVSISLVSGSFMGGGINVSWRT